MARRECPGTDAVKCLVGMAIALMPALSGCERSGVPGGGDAGNLDVGVLDSARPDGEGGGQPCTLSARSSEGRSFTDSCIVHAYEKSSNSFVEVGNFSLPHSQGPAGFLFFAASPLKPGDYHSVDFQQGSTCGLTFWSPRPSLSYSQDGGATEVTLTLTSYQPVAQPYEESPATHGTLHATLPNFVPGPGFGSAPGTTATLDLVF